VPKRQFVIYAELLANIIQRKRKSVLCLKAFAVKTVSQNCAAVKG
jgi:hypothetical protein